MCSDGRSPTSDPDLYKISTRSDWWPVPTLTWDQWFGTLRIGQWLFYLRLDVTLGKEALRGCLHENVGDLHLEITFLMALTATVKFLVHAITDSQIELTHSRDVSIHYNRELTIDKWRTDSAKKRKIRVAFYGLLWIDFSLIPHKPISIIVKNACEQLKWGALGSIYW